MLNKPPGLATQGGTRTHQHLDRLLDGLADQAGNRPKLVHRLDKDTSGVLLVARSARAASHFSKAFSGRTARKVYWALVVGVPSAEEGMIDLPLAKQPGTGGEKMHVDREEGLPAKTRWRLIDRAGNRAAWLELQPLTGRTHQLRAHMAAIGHPIVGDAKYGGPEAFLTGGISRKLHLHARRLRIDGPDGKPIDHQAELPDHFAEIAGDLGLRPAGRRQLAARCARPRQIAGSEGAAGGGGGQVGAQGAQGRAALTGAGPGAAQGQKAVNRLAIFDCDGTLVDSGATIHRALVSAFAAHGLDCPPPSVSRKVIGLSLVEAMAVLAPEADHEALSRTYKEAFFAMRQSGHVEEPLFDGILPLLDALEAEGWLLAVATGKSDRGLRHCLESHGIHARFVSLQTADRHPSKPHPGMALAAIAEAGAAPETSVVIGDTSFDIGMALAAGAGAIGAGWGYHEPDELAAAGAHAVAGKPADVLGIARQWVEKAA